MVHVGVKGKLDLYALAAAFRKAGRTDLGKALDRGIRSSAKVIDKAVFATTDDYMPKGYEKTFKNALKSKHEVKMLRGRQVSITYTARGKRELRQLEELEKGRMRHPVYGRYRRLKSGALMKNPWVTQRVKPRVIADPAMGAQPEAVKALDAAVQPLVRELNNVV